MLGAITKNRSVSTGLPGPIIRSHQPGFAVCGSSPRRWPAACASPVSAWQMNTALSRAGDSAPYVS